MIKRCEKLAFMKVTEGSSSEYKRMTGFTEFSVSKNPKEYSRKYIDEETERSSVVGYAPAISYKLDLDPENAVHKVFADIADRELVGDDTVQSILIVDISGDDDTGHVAVMRDFSIIPSSEGDDTDMYTCSGSLKASGEKHFGTATSSDNWKTAVFTEN